ncbi:MAG: glycosyltransferase family 39 protein, partial [Patescibacteria group bacterium]
MPKKLEAIILFFLLSITIFLSLFHLTESPSVWYDEGIYFQLAANLADGQGMSFQFAPNRIEHFPKFTVGYPLIYPLAGIFKIFGASILTARSTMVIWIFVLLILVYFFVRKSFGSQMALYSLALVATFPPLYGNGKSVLGEVPGLVFLIFALFMVHQIVSSKQPPASSRLILTGLFVGLCVATKPIFLLVVPAIAIGAYVMWRRKTVLLKHIGWGGLGVILPLAVWFLVQFLISSTSVSLPSILNFYANPYGVSSIFNVIKNNLTNFLTEAGPLYLLIMMAMWLVAVMLRGKKKTDIPAEEIIALSFSVFVSLAYLRIVGWHRYIFPAQIIALLYFIPSLSICIQEFYGKIKIKLPII